MRQISDCYYPFTMTTALPYNLLAILDPSDSREGFRGMDIGSNKDLTPGICDLKGQ